MTLELSQVAPQVRAMGQALDQQAHNRQALTQQAYDLLQEFSTAYAALEERIHQANQIQPSQRFDWIGAAPAQEPLAEAYALPTCPEPLTVIASDGSQILPDRHAIALYYLVNIGSIAYRHGSNATPEIYHPPPMLCHSDAVLDDQGHIITAGEIRAQRDTAEVKVLADVAARYAEAYPAEPVVALIDGQLTLRVIDLPFRKQAQAQTHYITLLNQLRRTHTLVAGYIDRPHSGFVPALLHLATLKPDAITDKTLRENSFRHLTDLDLFSFLGPGERSAIFAIRAKNLNTYTESGHAIHFFYLNVSQQAEIPQLARVEIPHWLAQDKTAVATLHAAIVRQARLTGGFPYVLARADELAIISPEEREAVEMMLAVEMRKQGLAPELSRKQANKNAFRFGTESFRL